MLNRNSVLKSKLTLEKGLPPESFFKKAWGSEPLTNVLTETNIPFALPSPDADTSIIVKNEEKEVIGQCSTNSIVKYWSHISNLDESKENKSTQTFVKIHKKAIEVEKKYLATIDQPKEQSLHSAGIAVIPEYRGKNIGLFMRAKQIEICKEQKAPTLFCETTNKFSAATLEKSDFHKIASYAYKDLGVELSHPELSKLDDSFSVWCLKLI